MTLTEKQSNHLSSLLKNLNGYCDQEEEVKPYLAYFKCGFAEIKFELFYEGKLITRGSYSEIAEYINQTK